MTALFHVNIANSYIQRTSIGLKVANKKISNGNPIF